MFFIEMNSSPHRIILCTALHPSADQMSAAVCCRITFPRYIVRGVFERKLIGVVFAVAL